MIQAVAKAAAAQTWRRDLICARLFERSAQRVVSWGVPQSGLRDADAGCVMQVACSPAQAREQQRRIPGLSSCTRKKPGRLPGRDPICETRVLFQPRGLVAIDQC